MHIGADRWNTIKYYRPAYEAKQISEFWSLDLFLIGPVLPISRVTKFTNAP